MIKYDAGKIIGETFVQELIDSGITIFNSWGDDGTYELPDDTPQVDVDAIAALFAAHDFNSIPILTDEQILAEMKADAIQEELAALAEKGTGIKAEAYRAEKIRQGK